MVEFRHTHLSQKQAGESPSRFEAWYRYKYMPQWWKLVDTLDLKFSEHRSCRIVTCLGYLHLERIWLDEEIVLKTIMSGSPACGFESRPLRKITKRANLLG